MIIYGNACHDWSFFHTILVYLFITGGLQNRYRDTPRGLPDSRRRSLRRRSCEVGSHEAGDHLEGKLKVPWNLKKMWNEFLLPKLFWHTVRKNCSSDREKIWNLRLKAKNLQNFEITRTICSNSESSEQFLVTECLFNLFLDSHRKTLLGFRNMQLY